MMRESVLMKNKDKIKHFLLALVLTLLIFWLVKNTAIAVLAVLILGLIKESIDQIRKKNTIREMLLDTLANVLGISLGLLIIKIIAS